MPSPTGDAVLPVPGPDQLAQLDESHARHQQVEPRVLSAAYVTYANASAAAPEMEEATSASVFSRRGWLVFEVVASPTGGHRTLLKSSLAQHVARATRGLVLAHGGGDAA